MSAAAELGRLIVDEARALGFHRVGLVPVGEAARHDLYQDWVAAGRHGEMAYLEQYEAERRHPRGVLESVRSVVMVALEYAPCSTPNSAPRTPNSGRVAAYARGPDYHRVVWDRLNALAAWLALAQR